MKSSRWLLLCLVIGFLFAVAGTGWPACSAPIDRPAAASTPTPGGDADSYEADNSAEAAWNIAVNELQWHTIYPAADEDWVRFAPPYLDASYTLTVQDGTVPLSIEVWVKRAPQTEMQLTQRWRMPAGSSQSLILAPDSGTDHYNVRVIAQQRTSLGSYAIAITDEQTDVPGSVDLLPTASGTPQPFYTALPTYAPMPTGTPTATLTPTATPCFDGEQFVADVTYPDGTVVGPAQRVDKVWRLRNIGSCPWTASYSVAFVGGNQMAGPPLISLPDTPPGATVDIGVTLYAPAAYGTHTGYWQMRNAYGALFGTRFLVQIVVPSPATPTPTATTPPPPPPDATISFHADRTDITAGECAVLTWTVRNVAAVYLDGHGEVGHGDKTVCPVTTTTYHLQVIKLDSTTVDKSITIHVAAAPVVEVPRPNKISPTNGTAFDHYPRTADFQWSAVSYPGGVTYSIEIQWGTPEGTNWAQYALAEGLHEPTYHMGGFVGMNNMGRWRVWAVSNDTGQLSSKTSWWQFHFTM